jgi:hypothetical protein
MSSKKHKTTQKQMFFSEKKTRIIFPMAEISPPRFVEFLQGDDRERSAGKT